MKFYLEVIYVSIALLICWLCAQPGYAQVTATVTSTIWDVQIKTIPSVVEVTVPASGNPRDFVSLVPPSAPNADYSNWRYTRDAKAGKLTFENMKPGTYELRYFALPGTTPAPGTLVGKPIPVIIPVRKPRPVEIESPGKVSIERRTVDSKGDVSIRIKDDGMDVSVIADKSDDVKVVQVP